jgi:magnesium transporter
MLIDCVVYQKGVRLRDIPLEEVSAWLGRPDSFVWVALKDASAAELACMQAQFKLHDLAMEDARKGHQRPKVEEYDDVVFAVLQPVAYADGRVSRGEVDLFLGKDFVLSVRSRSEQALRSVRARAEREPHLLQQGPGYVFYAICDAIVDRYFPVVEALEGELEAIEGAMFDSDTPRDNVRRLYEIKRQVGELRHAVLPLIDAFSKLYGGRVPAVVAHSGEYLRDVHDHLMRINAAIDVLRETIATAIQVNLSMVTIEQSEVAKRLAAWAAIFAVVTALAGIWGMNFEHMPELKWRYGYAAALGVMAAAGLYLYRRFHKVGWL